MGWQAGCGKAVEVPLPGCAPPEPADVAGAVASRLLLPRLPRSCTPEPHERSGVSEVSIAGAICCFRACTQLRFKLQPAQNNQGGAWIGEGKLWVSGFLSYHAEMAWPAMCGHW